jgi:predicted MFS family arabinose efflux permease
MLEVLTNKTYRRLFFAQVVSLAGTGLATVALALLAFDLAGGQAGAVLGTALAIKMVAYVGVSPIASAFAGRWPRRTLLISLDMVRVVIALLLLFVDQVWHIYVLILVLQSASAAFTPTFQATIPDILTDEQEYTKALSLSRLAYDLENLASPAIAALLLTFIGFHWLFVGTAIGFFVSALFVLSSTIPSIITPYERSSFYDSTTKGIRYYLATPRLRGLLAMSLAVAAAGAMVIVNTVVYVRGYLNLGDRETAIMLVAFGAGSMLAALSLPKLLSGIADRTVMAGGGVLMASGLAVGTLLPPFEWILSVWFMIGIGYSIVQVPAGRLLRRSSNQSDRPAYYAAQFSLSHACWLFTYPLAGWLSSSFGLQTTFTVFCFIAFTATIVGLIVWPARDTQDLEHTHEAMSHEHLHVHDEHHQHEHEGWEGPEPHSHTHSHKRIRHAHGYLVDAHHPIWPA